jgi:hypothetical protein
VIGVDSETPAIAKPEAAMSAGIVTCQTRSPFASLDRLQRFITTMLARKGTAVTKPVAKVVKPIDRTIWGSQSPKP